MNSRNRALLKKSCTLLDEVIDILETVMEEEINESWENWKSRGAILELKAKISHCKNSVQEILQ